MCHIRLIIRWYIFKIVSQHCPKCNSANWQARKWRAYSKELGLSTPHGSWQILNTKLINPKKERYFFLNKNKIPKQNNQNKIVFLNKCRNVYWLEPKDSLHKTLPNGKKEATQPCRPQLLWFFTSWVYCSFFFFPQIWKKYQI